MMSSEIGAPTTTTTTEDASPPGQQQQPPQAQVQHQQPSQLQSPAPPSSSSPSHDQLLHHHYQQQEQHQNQNQLHQLPNTQTHTQQTQSQTQNQTQSQQTQSQQQPLPDDPAKHALVPYADPDGSCRAIRSSFPTQNGELAIEVSKEPDSVVSADKHYKAAWKDEWVVSLIHLRGSMDEEFNKPQKSGVDMWSRVSAQMAEAHEDFDKNSESCRKKWQRVYKTFKDDKAMYAAPGADKHFTCKWFNLVDHYMHNHVDRGDDHEDGESAHANSEHGVNHRSKAITKRVKRDQKIKESLSKMVETWRESLEVLKDSEAKRLETLQRLSSTMTGLLEILKK